MEAFEKREREREREKERERERERERENPPTLSELLLPYQSKMEILFGKIKLIKGLPRA